MRERGLSVASGGELARSRRWQECLRPYGIGDELMTVCRDRRGCWGSVELMRDDTDPPFTDDDVELLDQLAPILGRLLRRSLLRNWQPSRSRAPAPPPATLILDPDLRVVGWTAAADRWLSELDPIPTPSNALPPAIYEIAARSLTPTDATTGLPASARLRTASGRWVTIEGAPLHGSETAQVAITLRSATAAGTSDLLARTNDLTRRESQLVTLLLQGLTSRELAHALSISQYTVQDHLKAIFTKTGLRSRRQLISHLTGPG